MIDRAADCNEPHQDIMSFFQEQDGFRFFLGALYIVLAMAYALVMFIPAGTFSLRERKP